MRQAGDEEVDGVALRGQRIEHGHGVTGPVDLHVFTGFVVDLGGELVFADVGVEQAVMPRI
ncbi:hypothetical protein [Corynebacterium glutamicum]|uniref:hypothetical protein n=1 Tax=Corynebacterium glutamicum TaxID=1718 RepID=UPI000B354801|nr:hypothetical protein [Corynebacterium glutamicum]